MDVARRQHESNGAPLPTFRTGDLVSPEADGPAGADRPKDQQVKIRGAPRRSRRGGSRPSPAPLVRDVGVLARPWDQNEQRRAKRKRNSAQAHNGEVTLWPM